MLFARPSESVRGWERAVDAQARIVRAVNRILDAREHGDIAIVAHGGVGTLLLCHLLKEPISRGRDQPLAGSCVRLRRGDARSASSLEEARRYLKRQYTAEAGRPRTRPCGCAPAVLRQASPPALRHRLAISSAKAVNRLACAMQSPSTPSRRASARLHSDS